MLTLKKDDPKCRPQNKVDQNVDPKIRSTQNVDPKCRPQNKVDQNVDLKKRSTQNVDLVSTQNVDPG